MWRDFGYAFRLLRKSPTFTLTAVVTLALCIGANTAIFSIVDALLFRPLPYPDPQNLATVAALRRGRGAEYEQTSQTGRTCELVRQNARSIDTAVASGARGVNLVSANGPQYVSQQRVSTGFFRVMGVAPIAGREFSEAEDRPGGAAVVVLSHDLWRRSFGGDMVAAIGSKITLRGEPYEVVGIMPPGFQSKTVRYSWDSSGGADLWTPLRPTTTGEGQGTNYQLLARVRPGSTWAQAEAELASIGESVIPEWKLQAGQTARLHLLPLQTTSTQQVRTPLLVLWAAVAMVLIVGCVNVAGLLLARSETRGREIATRMALGCGKVAIARQLLAENLLLALFGAAAGAALGFLALQGILALAPASLGVTPSQIAIDGRVLAVTTLAGVLTSLLFGIYPVLKTMRVDIRSALTQGGSRGVAGHRSWARRTLIVTEVTLSVVLLVCAGLLIRTFAHLTGLAPGFESRNVMTASLSLQDARYVTSERTLRLFDESLARIREMPGVEHAGIGLTLPYQRALNSGFTRADGPNVTGNWETSNVTYVTPGCFEALRMKLLRGRAIAGSDLVTTQPVAVVNEAFARRYLANQEAVGSHLKMHQKTYEVVGVIGDVQQAAGWGNFGPSAAVPGLYIPAAQMESGAFQLIHTWFSPSWVVRSSGPAQDLIAGLQSAVASTDPDLPFAEFRSMDDIRGSAFAQQRFHATLLGALAALAVVLAAVGIYGLIASSVIERTREIGIRMALGSTSAQAIRTVAIPGIALAIGGLFVGGLAAAAATKTLRSMLWGVQRGDPATFAAVAGVLLAVAALASLIPALRVSRIHPAQTLREE